MYTSNFASIERVAVPLSISRIPPTWYTGPCELRLAPSTQLLADYKRGLIGRPEYVTRFTDETLAPLDPAQLYAELVERYGRSVTLLCYEPPMSFCHRRLVAKWFEDNVGVDVWEVQRTILKRR